MLTAPEKLSIVRILPIHLPLLNAQIASLGSNFDADREAAIREELARWGTDGAKFTKLHPNGANKGVELNPDEKKADIKRNLAALLELQLSYTAAMGTLQIG